MEKIISAIRESYYMSDASIDLLASNMKKHSWPKKHVLIKAGTIERNYYFIEKGLTRSYCIINGEEKTTWFSKEGDITFSMLSAYEEKPGYEFVDLLEDCVIYSIPVKVLNKLYVENIEIANWSRLIHQKAFLDLEQRHISIISESARERYLRFIDERFDLFNRVNLRHISSFLGVTQVTLSRLRAEFLT